MPLWKIAWRSIQRRSLASVLTTLSMALGVMLVVSVLLIVGVVDESFKSNSTLGYDTIVGAKGGKLQLVLNTVFYLSQPVENLAFDFYQEFLPVDERVDRDRDGKYAAYVTKVVPVCLGDYYQTYRVVGTTRGLFNFGYQMDKKSAHTKPIPADAEISTEVTTGGHSIKVAQWTDINGRPQSARVVEIALRGGSLHAEWQDDDGKSHSVPVVNPEDMQEGQTRILEFTSGGVYEFASGRNFPAQGISQGRFEAILGARVARETGLQVGQQIKPAHGSPDGKVHEEFEIVGILAPSGTPQDRAVFVNMEGFNRIQDHIRDDGKTEVTSLLVKTKHTMASLYLVNELNEGKEAQGVKPIMEIYGLFKNIVAPIRNVLLVITFMICVVSGVSILVSIYNSMSDRRHEIAVMRSLGAGRGTVMSVVLLESVILSILGGVVGWVSGHALIGLASGEIEGRTGVAVSPFDLAPPIEEMSYLLGTNLASRISTELWLVPALIILAIVVGFLPALSAYRTDVAKALQSSP